MTPENKIISKMADEMASKLGEHCDSVRIFCVMPSEDGETVSYSVGYGNFYSQIGLIKEWIVRQDEDVRERVRNMDDDE